MDEGLFNYGLGLVRTAVPAVWGWLLGLLVSWGLHLPASAAGPAQALITVALVVVWYAVWHAYERHLPPWLTRMIMGANTAPSYTAPAAVTSAPVILKPTQTPGADRVG